MLVTLGLVANASATTINLGSSRLGPLVNDSSTQIAGMGSADPYSISAMLQLAPCISQGNDPFSPPAGPPCGIAGLASGTVGSVNYGGNYSIQSLTIADQPILQYLNSSSTQDFYTLAGPDLAFEWSDASGVLLMGTINLQSATDCFDCGPAPDLHVFGNFGVTGGSLFSGFVNGPITLNVGMAQSKRVKSVLGTTDTLSGGDVENGSIQYQDPIVPPDPTPASEASVLNLLGVMAGAGVFFRRKLLPRA